MKLEYLNYELPIHVHWSISPSNREFLQFPIIETNACIEVGLILTVL